MLLETGSVNSQCNWGGGTCTLNDNGALYLGTGDYSSLIDDTQPSVVINIDGFWPAA